MKKPFTLLAAFAATLIPAVAEDTSFSFTRHGEVVANGSAITCADTVIQVAMPGVVYVMGFETGLYLQNNTDDALKAIVRFEAIENCSLVSICCGGQCQIVDSASVVTVGGVNSEAIAGRGMMDLQCHAALTQYTSIDALNDYYAQFRLTAWPIGDEEDATSITVTIDGSKISASLDAVQADKAIAIEGRTFRYNFPRDAVRTLRVYDISGMMTMAQPLDGKSGTVALDVLPQGLYLYKVEGEGGACGKFIIR